MSLRLLHGTHASTVATRVGRTAHWPASVTWTRYRGRRAGVYARIGNRGWYITAVWWSP